MFAIQARQVEIVELLLGYPVIILDSLTKVSERANFIIHSPFGCKVMYYGRYLLMTHMLICSGKFNWSEVIPEVL